MYSTLTKEELIAKCQEKDEQISSLNDKLIKTEKFKNLLTLAIIHHYQRYGEMDKDNGIELPTLPE